MIIAPVLKKVASPPILWTVGKDVNPELIVNPVTPIDIGELDLEMFAPVKIPTANLPIGSVEYPTVVGILLEEITLHVITPITGLGDAPLELNCWIM